MTPTLTPDPALAVPNPADAMAGAAPLSVADRRRVRFRPPCGGGSLLSPSARRRAGIDRAAPTAMRWREGGGALARCWEWIRAPLALEAAPAWALPGAPS